MRDLTVLKPNELIRLAIEDMKKTIASGIRIQMDSWGIYLNDPDKCSVCFAGSVMLQLGKEPSLDNCFNLDTYDINHYVYKALDRLRSGDLSAFCTYLNVKNPLKDKLKEMGFSLASKANIDFNIHYERGKVEEFYWAMEEFAKLFD